MGILLAIFLICTRSLSEKKITRVSQTHISLHSQTKISQLLIHVSSRFFLHRSECIGKRAKGTWNLRQCPVDNKTRPRYNGGVRKKRKVHIIHAETLHGPYRCTKARDTHIMEPGCTRERSSHHGGHVD